MALTFSNDVAPRTLSFESEHLNFGGRRLTDYLWMTKYVFYTFDFQSLYFRHLNILDILICIFRVSMHISQTFVMLLVWL